MSIPTGHGFTAIQNLIHIDEISSTNALAKEIVEKMVTDDSELFPTVVIARRQVAGRGRAGRSWVSPGETSLALSLIVPWPEGPERILLPVKTGIALARGLSKGFGLPVRLKWPNDLLLGKRKVGGLLIETRTGADDASYAVIGLGLNVTTAREALDAAGLPDATSLAIEGASVTGMSEALDIVLRVLDGSLGEEVPNLPEAFEAVTTHLPGDRLTVRDGERVTEGEYLGITEQGMLRLKTDDGVETLVSGDVTEF